MQEGQKLVSRYCKARWCLLCNAKRAVDAIKGYKGQLEPFLAPFFVTLTICAVKAEELLESIEKMNRGFRLILQSKPNKRLRMKGIRKGECTYNFSEAWYHYHFHVIVDTRVAAEFLIKAWLSRFPESSLQAQDMRPCDEGSMIELFKYFSKMTGGRGKNRRLYPMEVLDVIFSSMRGKRVFQPFGGLRRVSEDLDDRLGQHEELEPRDCIWVRRGYDWRNDLAQYLSGYEPSERDWDFVSKL